MRDFIVPFGVFSFVTLAVLAVSPTKSYFTEWRQYQEEYNAYVKSLPVRVKPVHVSIQQQWIEDMDRVDRCVSCHTGIDNAALEHAPQPFAAHSFMYHKIEDMGCTICHGGEGAATTNDAAKGQIEYAESPLIPAAFLEGACGVCHESQEVPEAQVLSRGRRLIAENNCVACHQLLGVEKSFVPSLDGIGLKTTRGWLQRWLKNPKAVSASTKMPNFHLPDEEVNILTEYLLTLQESPSGATMPAQAVLQKLATTTEESDESGETLFRRARCISCHLVDGRGGTIATDLGKAGSKLRPEWLFAYLQRPKLWQPDVPMPQYGFSPQQIYLITEYITNELVDLDMEDTTEISAVTTPGPQVVEEGIRLFGKYNCGGCHRLRDFRANQNHGPDLTYIGSKPFYQFDFGNKAIPHTREAYLQEKLRDPRGFSIASLMPDFQFTQEEIRAMTTALFSYQDVYLPEHLKVRRESPSMYSPQGPIGDLIDTYACLTCHRIQGRGGNIAPDLTRAGSQLQQDWLTAYFKVPYTLRPIETVRMPDLFMPEEDIQLITEYIHLILRDNTVESFDNEKFMGNLKNEGARLYDRSDCAGCHQLNADGGYVGPPLDSVGNRLRPGWIYRWLEHPQHYKPGSMEPERRFSPEQLQALTFYLGTLR